MNPTPHDITEFIKAYVSDNGFTSVVVGNSGGIDSAVVMSLCVDALGKENVRALWLPCGVDASSKDAMLMRDFLDVPMNILDITSAYEEVVRSSILLPYGEAMEKLRVSGDEKAISHVIRHGNIKARLRMIMLYDHAAMTDSLVVGTSNLTELLTGYFTKWGDGACDFAPLARSYKKDVREMARIIGIPEKIITKPPSADLRPGQTDEEELRFTYEELDEILPCIVVGNAAAALYVELDVKSDKRIRVFNKYGGHRINDLENRIKRNRHKLRSTPNPANYSYQK